LGNQADPNSVTALTQGINDKEPLIRGASAWALRQINSPSAQNALLRREQVEDDRYVLSEIRGTY
jgi:epoxyqueuosine reductase